MNRERNLFLENAKCFCRCFPFSLIPISITSFDCFFQLFSVIVLLLLMPSSSLLSFFFASIRNIHVHICQMGVRRVEFHVFVRLLVGLKDLRNILYQRFFTENAMGDQNGDTFLFLFAVFVFSYFSFFGQKCIFVYKERDCCAKRGLNFDEHK